MINKGVTYNHLRWLRQHLTSGIRLSSRNDVINAKMASGGNESRLSKENWDEPEVDRFQQNADRFSEEYVLKCCDSTIVAAWTHTGFQDQNADSAINLPAKELCDGDDIDGIEMGIKPGKLPFNATDVDVDLIRVIQTWMMLTPSLRAAIVAIASTVQPNAAASQNENGGCHE